MIAAGSWGRLRAGMKKLLFMASQPFFQWRGSPIRVGFDVMALAELGYAVDLLVLPVGEPREIPGVRILRAPNLLGVRKVAIGPSFAKLAFDKIMFFQALGLARRNRYDVLHCVEDLGPVGVAVGWHTGAKVVFEKHSDPSSYKQGVLRNGVMAIYGAVERFTIRHADACIGTGPGLADQIRAVGAGRPVYHIPDIPSSLREPDPGRAAQAGARFRKHPSDVLIAYVGSFAVYQGVDLMFEAIPRVATAHPEARFVVIGGTPAEIESRTRWLHERGAGDRVVFPGTIAPDELPDVLAAADILLSPRLAGINTPLKLLDYLKAGGAIVATDTEANRLILSPETAVLTRPEPGAFAEGIARLIKDAGLRKLLASAGRRRVDETYNYREFKKGLKACYDGLTRGTA